MPRILVIFHWFSSVEFARLYNLWLKSSRNYLQLLIFRISALAMVTWIYKNMIKHESIYGYCLIKFVVFKVSLL